ncbi:MAG: hypothetical protein KDC66_07980 [Phaeodactylibacter sp.]|nr:hypothetical protein [Phaeodactylibacter sp.]MCB9274020.1 hypothetical protein [Lewinellaceae bacterium]
MEQSYWLHLTHEEAGELNASAQQLHHAAQFVALFGNSLLPKASDDSQSNMEWLPGLKALAGQEANLRQRVRMALLYDTFELQLIDENENALGGLPLPGQNKSTALSFVRTQARMLGLKPSQVKPIAHFGLPEHELDKGASFKMVGPAYHQELARYRHNAHFVLQGATEGFKFASPVATWPHHFDTGSVITLAFDDSSNPVKTIGIGLAIADRIADGFYFYVSPWQEKGKINFGGLPTLPGNASWVTGQWNGAVLKLSDIVKLKTAEEQRQLAEDFLNSAIEASQHLLGVEAVKA